MNAFEIQTHTLRALRAVDAQVLKSTVYSLSDEPAEEDVRQTVEHDSCQVVAVMTRDEFFRFQELANQLGVWVSYHWEPYGRTVDKFQYDIAAVEFLPRK